MSANQKKDLKLEQPQETSDEQLPSASPVIPGEVQQNFEVRELDIKVVHLRLLRNAEKQISDAQLRYNELASMVAGNYDIDTCQVIELRNNPPKMIVAVPKK